MALVPAIEFRNLWAQLSAKETLKFTIHLIVSHPHLLIELLSYRFINQSKRSTEDPLHSHCIGAISSIILSRDKSDTKSDVAKFDALPLRIIGLCSAYLDQKSNRRLSVCSRSIYLGANSPVMLQHFDLEYAFKFNCPPVDISLFPMVNNLALRINSESVAIIKYVASKIAKMSRLQSLDLRRLDEEATMLIAQHKAINTMVQCVSIHYQSISALYEFQNLQFLHLEIEDEEATATDSQMKAMAQTLRNLKGLTLIDCPSPFGKQLLVTIGNQLEYFAVNYFYAADLADSDFRNLKQFRIFNSCSIDFVSSVLSTAHNLEKVEIQLCSLHEDIEDDHFTLIERVLEENENLEYLEIRCDNFIEEVLDAISSGLAGAIKYEKKELKIKIYEPDHNTEGILHAVENEEGLIEKCVSIINQLAVSEVEQWMILLGGTNLIERLNDSVSAAVRISEDQESNLTVITNHECTINGYSAGWLM